MLNGDSYLVLFQSFEQLQGVIVLGDVFFNRYCVEFDIAEQKIGLATLRIEGRNWLLSGALLALVLAIIFCTAYLCYKKRSQMSEACKCECDEAID